MIYISKNLFSLDISSGWGKLWVRMRLKEGTMKRIAVAAEKDVVSSHFGLCEDFLIFNTEEGKICKIERVANPGHKPCELPELIHDLHADAIITGNMGKTAASRFTLMHIPYVIGASGEARA